MYKMELSFIKGIPPILNYMAHGNLHQIDNELSNSSIKCTTVIRKNIHYSI